MSVTPKHLRDALPPRLTAGDALVFTVQTAFPAGTFLFFVLTTLDTAPVRQTIGGSFNQATPPVFTPSVAVDADGAASFAVSSAATAAWVPGRYRWEAFSQDAAGNREQLASGELRIAPNPLAAKPADQRTLDEQILAQLYALQKGKTLDDVQALKIGTRELTKLTPKDVLLQIGVYEARVRNARARRGERVPSRNIGVVFGGKL